MKKISSVLLCALLSMSVFAQNKTYNGSYRLAVANTDGTANYSYKEVDDERVKEGRFIYNNTGDYYKINISGFYKNGIKDGHWKSSLRGQRQGGHFIHTRIRSNDVAFLQAGTTCILEGNYKNGVRDGTWTFTKTSADFNYSSKAIFKGGKFYGNFTATASGTLHKRGDGLKKISLKGTFTEGGFPDSLWIGKWTDDSGIEYLLKMTFERGRFVSLLVKDQSTGEDVTQNYKDISYIAGMYPENGIRVEWTDCLPSVFETMLGCWLWDETLMNDESASNPNKRQMKCLFLDWNNKKHL